MQDVAKVALPPSLWLAPQAQREEPVLQLISYSGIMPIVKHYTYAFQLHQQGEQQVDCNVVLAGSGMFCRAVPDQPDMSSMVCT